MEFYGTDWESLFSRIEEGEEELKCKRRSQFPNLPRNLVFVFDFVCLNVFATFFLDPRAFVPMCSQFDFFLCVKHVVVYEFICLNFFAVFLFIYKYLN